MTKAEAENKEEHKLDVGHILKHGKEVSTKEVLADVDPIDWSKELFF